MDICIQCDQEVDEVQVISHCGDCIVITTDKLKDHIRLAEAENADLRKQNDMLHDEVDQLEEDKEAIQTELDDLRFEIANT
jgi:cell division protein FtsB